MLVCLALLSGSAAASSLVSIEVHNCVSFFFFKSRLYNFLKQLGTIVFRKFYSQKDSIVNFRQRFDSLAGKDSMQRLTLNQQFVALWLRINQNQAPATQVL